LGGLGGILEPWASGRRSKISCGRLGLSLGHLGGDFGCSGGLRNVILRPNPLSMTDEMTQTLQKQKKICFCGLVEPGLRRLEAGLELSWRRLGRTWSDLGGGYGLQSQASKARSIPAKLGAGQLAMQPGPGQLAKPGQANQATARPRSDNSQPNSQPAIPASQLASWPSQPSRLRSQTTQRC